MHPLGMNYENKNSFNTGDPANSGLSRTQLKISQSISLAWTMSTNFRKY